MLAVARAPISLPAVSDIKERKLGPGIPLSEGETMMPKFRFEFHEFANVDTLEVDLPDMDAARSQAVLEAREALVDGAIEGVDRTASVTKVYDEAGYLVATVNFADLMSKEPDLDRQGDDTSGDEPGVMRSG